MAPPPLTVPKNKRAGFLLRARKKIATHKAICDSPEVLEPDRLSTASDRLEKAWTVSGARRDYLMFLGQDRNHLRALDWLDKDNDKEKKPPGKSDSATCSEECRRCKRRGHKTTRMAQDCRGRQVTKIQRLNAKPDNLCPCCRGQHSFAGKSGVVLYATRLSHCIKFKNIGTQERAKVLRTAEGCGLCTDWTGGQLRDACPYAAHFKAWRGWL